MIILDNGPYFPNCRRRIVYIGRGIDMKKTFEHGGMVMYDVAPWVVDVV